jgi:hypothetical protein
MTQSESKLLSMDSNYRYAQTKRFANNCATQLSTTTSICAALDNVPFQPHQDLKQLMAHMQHGLIRLEAQISPNEARMKQVCGANYILRLTSGSEQREKHGD